MSELHLPSAQLEALRHILASRLPVGVKIQVFGSRATGIGLKSHSDLDLLIVGPEKLPVLLLVDLREALSESDLPFSVNIVEAQYVEPEFLASLEELGTVELRLVSNTLQKYLY